MIKDSFGRFNRDYKKVFWQFLAIMVATWIISFAIVKLTGSTEAVRSFLKASIGSENTLHGGSFLPLFMHNFTGSVMIIILGLIPIPLYYAFIVYNAATVGLVLTLTAHPIAMFMAGILPHGILEIPAQIISAAISAKVVWFVFDKYIRHRDRPETFGLIIKNAVIDTIVFVLPLLFVAAIIEFSITPGLIHTFVGK